MPSPLTTTAAASLCRAVADLFADPTCWCQGATARDRDGRAIRPMHARAEAWDLMGGLIRTAWELGVSFHAYQVAVETVTGVALEDDGGLHAGHRTRDLCAWSDGMNRTASDAQRVCLVAWRRLRRDGVEVAA